MAAADVRHLGLQKLFKAFLHKNVDMYVASQAALVPWFFVLDHVNYSRWLPVHVRDMVMLQAKCPDVYREFQRRAFTAKKTKRPFSAISLDQAHEQVNALIKGDGGAVGLTENPAALRRWMIAGPGIARLVEEFEEGYDDDSSDSGGHHEQTKSVQDKFVKDVRSLVITIEEMGNPFMEESGDLINLNYKVVMPEKVVKAMQSMYATGVTKYDPFIEERFKSGSKSLSETIPRNSLPVFSKPGVDKPKEAGKLPGLKNDRNLFSRLYIVSQTREGDVDDFFRHENQPIPPALSMRDWSGLEKSAISSTACQQMRLHRMIHQRLMLKCSTAQQLSITYSLEHVLPLTIMLMMYSFRIWWMNLAKSVA